MLHLMVRECHHLHSPARSPSEDVMPKRLPELDRSKLSNDQVSLYDSIVESRGRIDGPFRTWLRSPQLAEHANRLGKFLRYDSSLTRRQSELAILATARFWDCQMEWSLHEKHALEAGLDPEVLESVRTNQFPQFSREDEQTVYEFTTELLYYRFVQDRTYANALEDLGETGTVELTALIGYYGLVAMTLNTFQIPMPKDVEPGLIDCPIFR